ncbi:MFS transporter [Microbacterium trichothecenolyticum]|uniref:Major Facilitator Superfamily protein n=1 Tax=Microbacterium trichothecenolyticum TaxID=69370 RepID=A0A0M2HHB7_MICTR|nr:MFS transporter [Microbacterium trichothecenolyticum]KJL43674.1 Major Facilitator Superfamily protein [Microbacterium trichothecenolyticum]
MHTTLVETDTAARAAVRRPSLIREAGYAYFPVALIARLPFAMMVVGILTLVVSARGSLALGGATSAMTGLGTALVGPLLGAAADRFGQRRVLLIAGAANSAMLATMAWLAFAPVPDAALLAVAFFIGATMPQVAPLSRSRLVGIIGRAYPKERRTPVVNGAMAYESAADEIVFVFGPVIVGLLATTLDPAAPVIGAAVLGLVFVSAFALHPTAQTATAAVGAARPEQAPVRELFRPRVLAPVVGALGMGLFFGAMLTSLTAFMAERGVPEQAGLVYGAMGIGSAALALGVALFPARFTLRARWLTFASILVAGTIALPFVGSIVAIAICLLVIGVGIGPTLVTQYSLAAAFSPRGRSATVMTMLGSAIVVGQSAASALTGLVADAAGAGTALVAPLLAASVVLGAGIWNAFASRH